MRYVEKGAFKGLFIVAVLLLLSACNGGGSGTDTTSSVVVSDGSGSTATGTGVVTLSWMPPTDNTDGSTFNDLSGYTIYYGTDATAMTNRISINNAGVTSYVIENLAANNTYYFVITALNSSGIESDHSNMASKYVSG
jgi:hypothetical protein